MTRPASSDGTDVPDTPTHPGRVVAWLGRHVNHALRQIDLSDSQYRLLAFLEDGASASTDLAGRLAVTRPSITALVDGLVARGFVTRHADEHDRRRVRLSLTDAGRDALADADRMVDQRLDTVLDPLPANERGRAVAGLDLCAKALRSRRDASRR